MAAYASAVTLHTNGTERISRNLGLVAGRIDITNYNSSTTEETGITRYFRASTQSGLEKGILSLQVTSSENGYLIAFNKSTGKFKAFRTDGQAPTVTIPFKDSDTAAAAGVGVYFDEDATAGQRILFVSPTNANGTETATVTAAADAALVEVANDVDLGTFDFVAIGFIA